MRDVNKTLININLKGETLSLLNTTRLKKKKGPSKETMYQVYVKTKIFWGCKIDFNFLIRKYLILPV